MAGVHDMLPITHLNTISPTQIMFRSARDIAARASSLVLTTLHCTGLTRARMNE